MFRGSMARVRPRVMRLLESVSRRDGGIATQWQFQAIHLCMD